MKSVSFPLWIVVSFLVINSPFPYQCSSYRPYSQLNGWQENSLHISLITVGHLNMRQCAGKFVLNFKEGLVASWKKTGMFSWSTT